jgi:hypothetical protein
VERGPAMARYEGLVPRDCTVVSCDTWRIYPLTRTLGPFEQTTDVATLRYRREAAGIFWAPRECSVPLDSLPPARFSLRRRREVSVEDS